MPALARELDADAVLWTSAVSPFARRRDRAVTDALTAAGIDARPHTGGYCADVSVPRTKAGKPMTVFTPFWRVQRELPRRAVLAAPDRLTLPDGLDPGELPRGPSLADELPGAVLRSGRDGGPRGDGRLARRARRRVRRSPRRPDGRHERPVGPSALGLHLRTRAGAARHRPRRRGRRRVRPPARLARLLRARPAAVPRERQTRVPGALPRARVGRGSGAAGGLDERSHRAIRSSTRGCASSRRAAGCTTARAWSSARS